MLAKRQKQKIEQAFVRDELTRMNARGRIELSIAANQSETKDAGLLSYSFTYIS